MSITDEEMGIIPRTLSDIFHRIDGLRQKATIGEAFSLSFSFLEIYNDQVW